MAADTSPHLERLLALAVSASARLLALAGERDAESLSESVVTLLQLPKLKPNALAPHTSAVTTLLWLPGDLLLTGTRSGQLWLWETRPPETRKTKQKTDDDEALPRLRPLAHLTAHAGAVRALCADPLARGIFSVGDDGQLCCFQLVSEKNATRLEAHTRRTLSEQPLRCLAFLPSERHTPLEGLLAVGGDDGLLRTLTPSDIHNTSSTPREVAVGEGGITALCFTDDDRIAVGAADGTLHLCFYLGTPDLELRSAESPHTSAIRALSLSPALEDEAGRALPRRLLSLGQEGTLRAWPLDSRRAPRTLELGRHATPTTWTWLPAPPKVERAQRGGSLFIGTRERDLFRLTLNEEGLPSETFDRIGSELERLESLMQARAAKANLAALESLIPLPEDEARLLIEKGLDASSPDVRMAAARALAQSGRRLSRPKLRQALRDSRADVRSGVFEALLTLEGPENLSPLKVALSGPHADIRLKGVQRLPALASRSLQVVNLLVERLHDDEQKVRMAALEGLLQARSPRIEALRLATQRGPADVGVQALSLLVQSSEHPSPSTRQLLLESLQHPLQPVREAAGIHVLTLQPKLLHPLAQRHASLQKLFSTLDGMRLRQSPPAPPLMSPPEDSLEPLPLTEETLEPLFALLACADPTLALQGAGLLASLGDNRAVGALLQLSREPQPRLRRLSVEGLLAGALAMPDDERLIQRLEWLLDDPVGEVRANAFQALQSLISAQGAPGLLMLGARALRSSQADMRTRAIGLLASFGGTGSFAHLENLRTQASTLLCETLHDEAKETRHEAFRILLSWHTSNPETALRLGTTSVHADLRLRVVQEATRLKAPFSFELLLARIRDVSASVGLAAYQALRDDKNSNERPEIHHAAFEAPPWEVRAEACRACPSACVEVARRHLPARVREPEPRVHLPAIEAADRLIPTEQEAFAAAFESIFYALRVRAGELAGLRRDLRAVEPMLSLLQIPPTHLHYPTSELRQRAARALADVGDPEALPACVTLLQDPDGMVREQAARAIANASRPGEEQRLVDALSHADLAVRSWAAEGLARLGDPRALPTLIGTLKDPHLPLRKGAVVSLTALGPEGISGLLQGLEDPEASLQSLVLSVLVARDVALQRAGLAPELLLNALAASRGELRFAAARALEVRLENKSNSYEALALELLGPPKPEKNADLKEWPPTAKREAFLRALLAGLASERPSQRYAAAQVLLLREQPLAFWSESKRMSGLQDSTRPLIPFTSWSEEERKERRTGWIRQLVSRPRTEAHSHTERVLTVLRFAGAARPRTVPASTEKYPDSAGLTRLVFGTYAGLVRQLPESGQAQEGHPVRRDSLERLVILAQKPEIGRGAVLPLLQLGLQDGHYLVRRAASNALQKFFPTGSLEPFTLMLRSRAEDMGHAGLEGLLAAFDASQVGAQPGTQTLSSLAQDARTRVVAGLDAPHPEVRATVLARLSRLYPAESLEPWLLGLRCAQADVRRNALDRLLQALDARQARNNTPIQEGEQAGQKPSLEENALEQALAEALSSEHEDLRLKAAVALAARGEGRAVEVLGLALRSEESSTVERALQALEGLARRQNTQAEPVAETLLNRLEDDPDKTAPRAKILAALGNVGSPSAAETLWRSLEADDASHREAGFSALLRLGLTPRGVEIHSTLPHRPAEPAPAWRRLAVGLEPLPNQRLLFEENSTLNTLQRLAQSPLEAVRVKVASLLYHLDLPACEALLLRLIQDRAPSVRMAACDAARLRIQRLESAALTPLTQALRAGRRELVLSAARGLALRQKKEALQPLLLVLKAGEPHEKEPALLALARLGDRRVLPELQALLTLDEDKTPEQLELANATYEALGALLPTLEEEDRLDIRKLFEELLRSGNDGQRLRVLRGLQHAGDEKSRITLEQVALDKRQQGSLRLTALEGLAWLSEKGSRPVLEHIVQTETHGLAEKALEGLLGLGEPLTAYRTALGAQHEGLQQKAVDWLAKEAPPEALIETLGSQAQAGGLHSSSAQGARLRATLRQGLLRRSWRAEDRLTPLLVGELPQVRAEAGWLTGGLPDASVEGLVPGLEKGLEQLRQAAERLLRKRGWPVLSTRQNLENLRVTNYDQPEVQRLLDTVEAVEALVWALEQRGAAAPQDTRTRAVLQQLRQEERLPEYVVTRVKRLLGDTGQGEQALLAKLSPALRGLLSAEAVSGLMALAQEAGQSPARLEGLSALGRLGTVEARQVLERVLAHPGEPEEVRKVAFRALRRVVRREASRG
ncbi:MAG: HEAT repeat domain-containing protein [Myxococcota bacterium]